MVRAATLPDDMLSLKPYLNYLVETEAAEHAQTKWGRRYRWAINWEVIPALLKMVTK